MGYSVRDDKFRYTVWTPWDGDKLVGRFDVDNYGVELYAHLPDGEEDNFNNYENVNLAGDPRYAQDVDRLHAAAVAQWSK